MELSFIYEYVVQTDMYWISLFNKIIFRSYQSGIYEHKYGSKAMKLIQNCRHKNLFRLSVDND